MSLKIEHASLEQLQETLPRLLSNLSIGRAQIVLEQLRSNLQNRPHDEILFYLARKESESELPPQVDQTKTSSPIAALIAIQQPCTDEVAFSDAATILHAGFLQNHAADVSSAPAPNLDRNNQDPNRHEQPHDQDAIITQMRKYVDWAFSDRGIRFVQWATDATDHVGLSAKQWYDGLGFRQIATLDYLTGNTGPMNPDNRDARESEKSLDTEGPQIEVKLRPVAWDCDESRLTFTQLVEATYAGTLDCPDLSQYRTTSETLRGYQTSTSFAPDLWFEVMDPSNPNGTPIGCMILAKHGEAAENSQPELSDQKSHGKHDPAPAAEGPVLEIVYMGLLPETRGKGFGRLLVDQAAKLAIALGGTRIILGVDQTNRPAREIYADKGMTPLLSETVWVKRVESGIQQSA